MNDNSSTSIENKVILNIQYELFSERNSTSTVSGKINLHSFFTTHENLLVTLSILTFVYLIDVLQ